MSAWIVTKVHIDTLVSAGLQFQLGYGFSWYDEPMPQFSESYQAGSPWGDLGSFIEWRDVHKREMHESELDRIGRMLWATNHDSVNHRYNDLEIEDDYHFERISALDPLRVAAAISCYEYQSCEHEGWATSEAKQYINALRTLILTYLVEKHPDTPWGVDSRRDVQTDEHRATVERYSR